MQRWTRWTLAVLLVLGAGVGLAAPASAATISPVTPVGAGETLTVSGSGCTPSGVVNVRASAPAAPQAQVDAPAVTSTPSGDFSVSFALVSTGLEEFHAGQQVAVAVRCSGGGPDSPPDAITYFYVASAAPPVVTFVMPAAQHVFGTASLLKVRVEPGMSGVLTVSIGGTTLEEESFYWLGEGTYRVPASLPVGVHELVARFEPHAPVDDVVATGTFTVVEATTTTTLSSSASSWKYGSTRPTVTARISSLAAGRVEFSMGGRVVGRVAVVGQKASLRLPSRHVGRYAVVAKFVPSSSGVTGSSASTSVRVTKATSTATVKASKKVKVGKKAELRIRVKVKGVAKPTGKIAIYDGKKKIKTISLKSSHEGKRTVKIALKAKGTHKLKVRYLGSKDIKADNSPRVKVRVR